MLIRLLYLFFLRLYNHLLFSELVSKMSVKEMKRRLHCLFFAGYYLSKYTGMELLTLYTKQNL